MYHPIAQRDHAPRILHKRLIDALAYLIITIFTVLTSTIFIAATTIILINNA